MVFAGDNNYLIRKNLINNPVFLSNTARPMAGKVPFQRFRFAGSMKTNHNFAACSLAACIASSTVSKVIMFFHSLTSLIALSKCSLLAGDLMRYSVSSQSGSSFSNSGCCRTRISMLWSGYASFSELTNSTPRSLELSRYIASMQKTIAEAKEKYKLMR